MPVGGGDVRAVVWSRLHSRRACRQRACHPQRRGRQRVSTLSELDKLCRVIACYRTLSRVIAVIASYRGDNSVIAGPRTLRNRGAGPSSRRRNAKTQALTQACRSQSSASSSSRHFSSHCLCSSVSSSKPGSKMSSSSRVARTTESVGVCRAARSRAHPPSGRQGEVSGGLSNLSQIIANYRTLSQLSRVIAAR